MIKLPFSLPSIAAIRAWINRQANSVRNLVAVQWLTRQLRPLSQRVRRTLLPIKTRIKWTMRRQLATLRSSFRYELLMLGALVVLGAGWQLFSWWTYSPGYELSETHAAIIGRDYAPLGERIEEQDDFYGYNVGYSPGGETLKANPPAFSAQFAKNPKDGVTVTDTYKDISLTLKPKFSLKSPQVEENRVIYPLARENAVKVISLGSDGYKEDILLNEFSSDSRQFRYQLELESGLEARLETDGSIGVYGAPQLLLGDVQTGSEADAKLLAEARENAEKNTLIFTLPAPFIIDAAGAIHDDKAWFELDGSTITVVASELADLDYPVSVDPSIYVDTARKLMQGNNETNIEFDVANGLFQKGFTTGARFRQWDSTMNLNVGRYDGASTVAGGYVYQVGGIGGDASNIVATYDASGNYTYAVPEGATEVTIEAWGAGGGGGGGGTNGDGGNGGGGAYTRTTVSVTAGEDLDVIVGGNGSGGDTGGTGGDGGGGGGHSEVLRSSTPLAIAAGGGGGGGGDNSSSVNGGQGGAGGDETNGIDGGNSSNAGGGEGGSSSAGGSGGAGGNNSGSNGSSEQGGSGADGRSAEGPDGGEANGGSNGGGSGGTSNVDSGFGAGGGGGGGYYGGGGGSGSQANDAGGGAGGGGSSYLTGTNQTAQSGSDSSPGNVGDADRAGAGQGGSGGSTSNGGADGTDGLVIITFGDVSSQAGSVAYQAANSSTGTSTTLDIGNSGNDRLVVIMADEEGSGTNLTGVTVDGNACNLVTRADNPDGAGNHQEMWYCDEDDLGSSSGTVTVAIQGGDGGWAVHAHTYYGVVQTGPNDSGIDETSVDTGTATVNNIDVSKDGLVIMGAANGNSPTWDSYTSPLIERTDGSADGSDPSSAVFSTASAIETTTQTNKTYVATASSTNTFRITGIVASWDAQTPASTPNESQSSVFWAEIDDATSEITSPNPGPGVCTAWCTESVYDLPEVRKAHSLVAYNGFLYVLGGEDDSDTRQTTVYIAKLGANGEPQLWHPTDSNKDNWVYWYQDTSLPEAVSYTAAVGYNNRLYLLGGQTNSSPGGTTTVRYTDIEPTGTLEGWTTTGVLGLSTARHQHSVETYNDVLYVVGGDSSTSGSLLNSVEYVKLAPDGTFDGSWETTESFETPRRTNGGNFTTIFGAYLYLMGGCDSVSAGECQSTVDDVKIASINADGTLSPWTTASNVTTPMVGFGLEAWGNNIYKIGGCTSILSGDGCASPERLVERGEINQDGDASTVNITQQSGSGDCVGADPFNCDLPSDGSGDPGDGPGEIGHLLNVSIIVDGYLYVIGGCTDYTCEGTNPGATDVSGNVAYVEVDSDGTLRQPATCIDNYYGSWCVDSTNQVNGTTGTAAAGITSFDGRIYVIGGLTGSGNNSSIWSNAVNDDGSLDGTWEQQSLSDVGMLFAGGGDVSYTWAFTRANPNEASTYPGNLYVVAGCAATNQASCAGAHRDEVYKCNIETDGLLEEDNANDCTTAGQLQMPVDISLHSGTLYANYIYIIGGFSDGYGATGDRDTVYYAQIDDNNDIVAVDGETDWVLSPNTLSTPRRRGWAFGYNGYIYGVGGYDDSGGGTIIPDIEFAKVDVSDGSIGTFSKSDVTVNQRWGLSMAVSNAYAYVIGGCNVGSSPGGCSSFEPSVQTFQLYNNESGAVANYTESTGDFALDNSRIGSSAAILDGYMYVAGGENSGSPTSDVQFAELNPNGTIGSWSNTSAALPATRAYGQLEAAGGSLYYVGGDSGSGAESDVYYATPTTTTGSSDTIRSTTYKLGSGEFTGTDYTLTLNNDLESDYFVMIAGSTDINGDEANDDASVRVDGDPFGNLGSTTNADEIVLSRQGSGNSWVGTATVVECISSCGTDGFQLDEVLDVSLPAGSGNTLQQTNVTLAAPHNSNTVPFGGYLGGGLESANTDANEYSVTAGVRLQKNATDELRIERYGGENRTPEAADLTVYMVDWGSNWGVQEVDFNSWNSGGGGADDAGEYTTQTISSVTRDNSWVWKSVGISDTDGLGDGAFGKIVTLGDGTSTQNVTETTVALGSQQNDATRDDTVYVMENSQLDVDYRFETESNKGSSFTMTVDAAIESESVTTQGNITSSEGYRIPLFYYGDNGSGQAFTRVGGWSHYHSNDTTVSLAKSRTGNNQAGWLQSVDFGAMAGTSGGQGDIASWSTASNGLPAARANHGATVWNDRIFVVGGTNGGGSPTNTIYTSPQLSSGGDITSGWTTQSAANEFEVERSGATAIAYANNLYVFGGNDGTDYFNDSQFTQINSDGTLDPWSYSTSIPSRLSNADGFAANGFVYLVGGRSAATDCSNSTYVAPISANTTIASGNNPTGFGEWFQTNVRYSGERQSPAVAYNEGKIYISGGGCNGTELTSDQHYYGTVKSQPQVARYSRMIDTDSDVFPTKWLLNGLDNSIGARWETSYRSSTDANNAWGQTTNFGEVTLGQVENYVPIDGSGTNTNFARYFYFTISIDSSQAYGYPDDVERGPMIDDLTLFFTSDPSKRLRHGKTFTGGLKQPIDTPPGN